MPLSYWWISFLSEHLFFILSLYTNFFDEYSDTEWKLFVICGESHATEIINQSWQQKVLVSTIISILAWWSTIFLIVVSITIFQ